MACVNHIKYTSWFLVIVYVTDKHLAVQFIISEHDCLIKDECFSGSADMRKNKD